jgi:N-acylglucosamine-6-phosphate 2-epimerase
MADTNLTSPPESLLAQLRHGIIVSCQAPPGNPMRGSDIVARMAIAATHGGACAIRVNGLEDTAAVMAATSLPCLALYKVDYPDSDVRITPTLADTRALVGTGAPMIALDATDRPRPHGELLADSVAEIHAAGALAFGDCARPQDLAGAIAAGCDAIGTTLAGYTAETQTDATTPDLETLAWFVAHSPVPVYAEGRFWHPAQVAEALAIGAHCVVVGTAITNPMKTTAYFIAQAGAAGTRL